MTLEKLSKNKLLKLSFDFALGIIAFCEVLQNNKKFVIANQLLKSGTAVGAILMEAQNSESRADFIHKLKMAAKEAEEAQYWLWLCIYSAHYPSCEDLLHRIDQINRMLGSAISTLKKKIAT